VRDIVQIIRPASCAGREPRRNVHHTTRLLSDMVSSPGVT
jgi:hypothetical protein